jgi:hypothetical protein
MWINRVFALSVIQSTLQEIILIIDMFTPEIADENVSTIVSIHFVLFLLGSPSEEGDFLKHWFIDIFMSVC